MRDDSVFNESFAVTVEQEGSRRWLERYGTDADRKALRAGDAAPATASCGSSKRYRERLEALYETRPAAATRCARARPRSSREMRADYAQLKESWGGFAGYDRWFAQEPNNALLASVGIYTQARAGLPGAARARRRRPRALLRRREGARPHEQARAHRGAGEPHAADRHGERALELLYPLCPGSVGAARASHTRGTTVRPSNFRARSVHLQCQGVRNTQEGLCKSRSTATTTSIRSPAAGKPDPGAHPRHARPLQRPHHPRRSPPERPEQRQRRRQRQALPHGSARWPGSVPSTSNHEARNARSRDRRRDGEARARDRAQARQDRDDRVRPPRAERDEHDRQPESERACDGPAQGHARFSSG